MPLVLQPYCSTTSSSSITSCSSSLCAVNMASRVLSERQKNIRSKFWTLKNRYYPILFLCFSSFLSYNFFQQILFTKKKFQHLKKSELLFSGGPEHIILNYVLYNFGLHFGQNLFLPTKFYATIFIWPYLSS